MSSRTQVGCSFVFRVVSISLIICLLTTSTPAAPLTIVNFTKEWSSDLAFWYKASELAHWIQGGRRAEARPQETQSERDGRVVRIQIFPGDVVVDREAPLNLSAVPYDAQGATVGGVTIKWTAYDEGRTRGVPISPKGEFQGAVQGRYRITAEGAGRTAHAMIIVRDGPRRPKSSDKPTSVQDVSNADRPPEVALRRPRQIKKKSETFAHARATMPAPLPVDDGWNGGNYWSSHDPIDRIGDPPGNPIDGGAGSGNFQFAAPIYERAGRGLNINLTAAYNGRLWNKAGSQITYDIDRGWPAPGWSLGFGKMLSMGTSGGAILVEADGTRHNYSGTIQSYSSGYYSFLLHTNDGTFIDYSGTLWNNGANISGKATLANGTVINYSSMDTGVAYPTWIEDPNGNYITITYVNGNSERIQTITDTLGRVVTFHYDSNNLLTAITGSGLGGGTRTLATFHYHQLTLSYSFSGLTPIVRNSSSWVIDAIYYPGTNTGYWFNDSDSYSTFGMIRKVSERRNMSFSCPTPVPPGQGITAQCTINSAGTITRELVYNYPAYVNDPSGTQSSNLTDAPTYTTLTESWTRDGTSTMDQAVTSYDVHENSSPRTVEITQPNGTKSQQYSYNSPGTYLDGLVYLDETRDASGTLLQSSTSTWAAGDYGSPRPSQVQATNHVIGKTTTTTFTYGSVYNQVTDVRNYGYNNELLRSTRTTYQNSTSYTGGCDQQYGCWGRHVFNLPLSVEIYDGSDNRLTRNEYQYDGQTLTQQSGITQHDQAFNPYADAEGYCYYNNDWNDADCMGTCLWECPDCQRDITCDGYCPQIYNCPYDASTDFRGNITQITDYATVTNSSLSGPVTETRRYDIAGNLVTATKGSVEQTTFNYTLSTQYAFPVSRTRGSASDPYAQVTTSNTYDFNTGLGLSVTDANGRQSISSFDANTLRLTNITAPTGAHTEYAYDDNAMSVTATAYLAAGEGGAIANKNVKVLNGRGDVRQEQALGANNVWDYVDTVYDNMRQVSQQALPYRSGDTLQWTTITYDALGRQKTITAPDGSVTQNFFDEPSRPSAASSAAGETTRAQDAWGREIWHRIDATGRLVEVVEPDPEGSGAVASNGLATIYSYNTLGNLTQIVQGSQSRSFKYDSLGRLIAQKLAEASATLNDAGTYVGSGTWSDVFTYDDRSNLTSRKDARGVKTVYTYNNDPLNRLQSVSWDTSGFGDTANPILPAAAVSYSYRTKSSGSQLLDVTQPASVSASGISTVSYSYDSEGRVSAKTLTLSSRSSFPFITDYIYDSLDRAKDIRYPAEYGNGSAPRKIVHQDYDVSSRLSGLTFDGQSFASNIAYNAASDTTSLNVGTGTNQVSESYSYNAQTGSLDSQTATRNGTTLLNLSYDYANANGKRTGQLVKISNNLDHTKDRGYEYDALGRLKRATGGQNVNWEQRYSYDRYGNRNTTYSYTADGTVPRDGWEAMSYDNANHITLPGWSYDAAGNQTRVQNGAGWQRFQYDAANRLVKIKADDNVTVLATYTYGDSNERLIADEAGTRTYYHDDGGATITEYTESGASTTPLWSKSYVYLGERLLSTLTPNGGGGEVVQYQHPDQLGTRLITNPANGTSFEQVTLPFGTALAAESSGATNRRFTSYDRSATTGLDYALNRHYDSQQGRFTQVDPIGMESTNLANPQTLNLYAYCTNDPINHTDPSGLGFFSFLKKVFKWIGVALAVAAVVATLLLAQYLALPILRTVFMMIVPVANAAAAVANALGFTKLADIIRAAGTFGQSIVTAIGTPTLRNILTAISNGAAVVAKILTDYVNKKLGQIFDLVSSVTKFVSDHLDMVTGKFRASVWEIYKFARATTEKIATIAGADRLASFLKKVGVIDDFGDIYLDIRHLVTRPRTRFETIADIRRKVKSIFDRFKKQPAPAH